MNTYYMHNTKIFKQELGKNVLSLYNYRIYIKGKNFVRLDKLKENSIITNENVFT